jgi:hypothetical protein
MTNFNDIRKAVMTEAGSDNSIHMPSNFDPQQYEFVDAARQAFLDTHDGLQVALDFAVGYTETSNSYIAGGMAIVRDISNKLTEYSSLSDKQVALCLKLYGQATTQTQQRQQDAALLDDAPAGKLEVIGTILSTKVVSGEWGETFKMLLLCESPKNFKLWVTVPSAINTDAAVRGAKVKLTCTVEPSRDDAKFAYGSRPSKASLLA